MKNLILIFPAFLLVFFLSTAQAVVEAPLGDRYIAIKGSYVRMTDSSLERLDIDGGAYVGIEGYVAILNNIYVGAEYGQYRVSGSSNSVKTELIMTPIELNAKYAVDVAENLVLDIGGGLSYNHLKVKQKLPFRGTHTSSDSGSGMQLFSGISYRTGRYLVGLNAKYHIINDESSNRYDTDSWRTGAHMGVTF